VRLCHLLVSELEIGERRELIRAPLARGIADVREHGLDGPDGVAVLVGGRGTQDGAKVLEDQVDVDDEVGEGRVLTQRL
jgi:hypothetical protein